MDGRAFSTVYAVDLLDNTSLSHTLCINDTAPDFTAETTKGGINFHDWIGDGWAIIFSRPKDFTPVCTTELGVVAGLQNDFAACNCKVIGISVDGVSPGGNVSGTATVLCSLPAISA